RRDVICFRELYKIGIYHLGTGVSLLVEQLLPLTYHAEVADVQHEDLYGDLVLKNGTQFLHGHLITTITDDSNNVFVRARGPGADGGAKGKSHGARTTRGHIRELIAEPVTP